VYAGCEPVTCESVTAFVNESTYCIVGILGNEGSISFVLFSVERLNLLKLTVTARKMALSTLSLKSSLTMVLFLPGTLLFSSLSMLQECCILILLNLNVCYILFLIWLHCIQSREQVRVSTY
jgi:hypothetical protein